ncbi:elongator complex protein 2-like [Oscarella lobularis]|uniref:elongator complex protein 2-like n=1 Tax=Oscarella lobularis TaxID=121494 RepID=UPI003313A939
MADLVYTSSGCNRSPFSADWGSNGLIAYGSSNCVLLYSPKEYVVARSLQGHKGRVNCVAWIEEAGESTEREPASSDTLVTGAADSSVIVWKNVKQDEIRSDVLTGSGGSITAVKGAAFFQSSDRVALVVAASTDSSVCVWKKLNENAFERIQRLDFESAIGLCIDLTMIRAKAPLMAIGFDGAKVCLYTWQEPEFVVSLVLDRHADWVRDVSFARTDDGRILLATCSQDAAVHVWSFAEQAKSAIEDETPLLKTKELTFEVYLDADSRTLTTYVVSLESILLGHEDWVYSVDWHSGRGRRLRLLSSSMDKTMIIWELDDSSGLWMDKVRVGEVGGNTLGYFGGVFSPEGDFLLGHTYQGAFHLWKKASESDESETWVSDVVTSGHFGPVQSVSWANGGGRYLLSCALDQTTRLHAPWKRDKIATWHEIGRPQVHGYDMQFVVSINDGLYVSAADEKVIRVFGAPKSFVYGYEKITGSSLSDDVKGHSLGASVPALGLSNKAVFAGGPSDDPATESADSPAFLTKPPVDEDLLQNTLWPETQKLYGHGYEVFCLAVSPDGRLLASACKATKTEHAAVRIWDVATWRQVQCLSAHALTVTQMGFSRRRGGERLLTVSRDRTWSLWRREEDNHFELEYRAEKKAAGHSRIIWTCSWSLDDLYFATGSRDKKVIVWGFDERKWIPASPPLEASDSVTALDFSPRKSPQDKYTLAIGLESGQLFLYTWCKDKGFTVACEFHSSLNHSGCVKQLQWRQTNEEEDGDLLASCSDDNAVKIFRCSNTSEPQL